MADIRMPAALRRFVEEELARTPLLADQVIEETLVAACRPAPSGGAGERGLVNGVHRALTVRRHDFVHAFVESLRRQAAGEPQAEPGAIDPMRSGNGLPLALVDESAVAADVEISHAIEAIRNVAEYELRELVSYVSALVGDMDVTRDHNPLRPESYARALWAGAQALPLSAEAMPRVVRLAAEPLARQLRKAFAAASRRLEDTGIEPAVYRTLILPIGSRTSRPSERSNGLALQSVLGSLPTPGQPGAQAEQDFETALREAELAFSSLPADRHAVAQTRSSQRERLLGSARNPIDQQLVELITRLFDVMLVDRRTPPAARLLLSRLQGSVLRVALAEPAMLDDSQHPVWRFMDRVAHLTGLQNEGSPEHARWLAHAESLVGHVLAERTHGTRLYSWALERLDAYQRHDVQLRLTQAQIQVKALRMMENRLLESEAMQPSQVGALDVTHLDTVPADLLDGLPAAAAGGADTWFASVAPGEGVRMFLQGRWRSLYLLWPGERGEIWLFGEIAEPKRWAVRRAALERLLAVNLMQPLQPRSLVESAAEKVLRELGAA